MLMMFLYIYFFEKVRDVDDVPFNTKVAVIRC